MTFSSVLSSFSVVCLCCRPLPVSTSCCRQCNCGPRGYCRGANVYERTLTTHYNREMRAPPNRTLAERFDDSVTICSPLGTRQRWFVQMSVPELVKCSFSFVCEFISLSTKKCSCMHPILLFYLLKLFLFDLAMIYRPCALSLFLSCLSLACPVTGRKPLPARVDSLFYLTCLVCFLSFVCISSLTRNADTAMPPTVQVIDGAVFFSYSSSL